jgi:type VI secretion system protein VasJ
MDLTKLGKEAIRPGPRAGRDMKYDPAMEALQAEMDKAVSVLERGAADWGKIAAAAADILVSQSKDFIVAGYLALALIRTRRAEGFAIGSGIMIDLIESFWEDGWPVKDRARARSRAIAWWVERSSEAVTVSGCALSPEETEKLCARLEKTHSFLRSRLDECPSLGRLITAARQAVERAAQEISEPELPESPASVPTRQGEDARFAMEKLGRHMNEVSRLLLNQSAANPLAYRLNRASLWAGVEELPPAADGRTHLAPPEPQVLERIHQMEQRKDFHGISETTENESFRYIFWLDLQRYAEEALSRMGSRFGQAAEVVAWETASLVGRLPGLETLAFSDGTPFADPETRRWLREIQKNRRPVCQS